MSRLLGGGLAGGGDRPRPRGGRPPAVEAEIAGEIEPRDALGQGLAYSTTEPAHRINVPAAKMSLINDEPDHFIAWLASPDGPMLSPGTATLRGDLFPQRSVFGRYVGQHLAPYLQDGTIRHLRAAAASVARAGGAYDVTLSDGSRLRADFLVISMSHPLPGLPAELLPLAGSPRLLADPYDNARVAAIGPTDEVLIVGTGLTTADVVASLEQRCFWGHITALSRHGLWSREHGPGPRESDADFAAAPATSAVALLRRVRAAIAADAARGFTWHAVIDRLRTDGTAAWQALDDAGRARVVRHLRSLLGRAPVPRSPPRSPRSWSAGSPAATSAYVAARLVGALEVGRRHPRLLPPARRRRDRHQALRHRGGDDRPLRISRILRTNPALKALSELGLIRPDPLGLGIRVRDALPHHRRRRRPLTDPVRQRPPRPRPRRRADGRPRGHRPRRNGRPSSPLGARGPDGLRHGRLQGPVTPDASRGDVGGACRRSSMTVFSLHGIHTSRREKAKSVTDVSGTFRHPCSRPLRRKAEEPAFAGRQRGIWPCGAGGGGVSGQERPA